MNKKPTTKNKPEGSGYPGPDVGLVGDRTGSPASEKSKKKGKSDKKKSEDTTGTPDPNTKIEKAKKGKK